MSDGVWWVCLMGWVVGVSDEVCGVVGVSDGVCGGCV